MTISYYLSRVKILGEWPTLNLLYCIMITVTVGCVTPAGDGIVRVMSTFHIMIKEPRGGMTETHGKGPAVVQVDQGGST